MTQSQADQMATDSRVSSVEENGPMFLATTQTLNNDPNGLNWEWGLDAIDQASGARDYQYTYTNTGAGVHIFIVDTGVWGGHSEFGNRVLYDYNVYGNQKPAYDRNGHGTMVASIAGGTTTGVAKLVTIHSVKVYDGKDANGNPDPNDKFDMAKVAKGLEWVLKNYKKKVGTGLAVVHCSFISGPSLDGAKTVKKHVDSLLKAGVPVVVPAGNYGYDVSNFVPANVTNAITVGGAYPDFTIVPSFNYGAGIDLFGPGDFLRAASWLTGSAEPEPRTTFTRAAPRSPLPSSRESSPNICPRS